MENERREIGIKKIEFFYIYVVVDNFNDKNKIWC